VSLKASGTQLRLRQSDCRTYRAIAAEAAPLSRAFSERCSESDLQRMAKHGRNRDDRSSCARGVVVRFDGRGPARVGCTDARSVRPPTTPLSIPGKQGRRQLNVATRIPFFRNGSKVRGRLGSARCWQAITKSVDKRGPVTEVTGPMTRRRVSLKRRKRAPRGDRRSVAGLLHLAPRDKSGGSCKLVEATR
jgi:hypothetical protein